MPRIEIILKSSVYQIIEKKEKHQELSYDEIKFMVNGFTKGEIPDYQMSAFLMAIFINSMTDDEATQLTLAILESGEQLDFSSFDGIVSDKHSSGGVGDKTSMAVVPVVAALGGKVAKMSGRALGFSGGTIDKLEAISGFKVELPIAEFMKQVDSIGASIIAANQNLAPADKKIYALRDVTATVGSIPLIASSIMSKKLASGAQAIVLDVKCGNGAFMKTFEDAKHLAKLMIKIGKNLDRKMSAVITNMDIPTGHYIGNALEVYEVIETLSGRGPEDLVHEIVELSSIMLYLSGLGSISENQTKVKNALNDGSALKKFQEIVQAQGGDLSIFSDSSKLIGNPYQFEIKSNQSGYISAMNTEKIGKISMNLGAGRKVKTGPIDYLAGLKLLKKVGDLVEKDEIIAIAYSSDQTKFSGVDANYCSALTFSEQEITRPKIILETLF